MNYLNTFIAAAVCLFCANTFAAESTELPPTSVDATVSLSEQQRHQQRQLMLQQQKQMRSDRNRILREQYTNKIQGK